AIPKRISVSVTPRKTGAGERVGATAVAVTGAALAYCSVCAGAGDSMAAAGRAGMAVRVDSPAGDPGVRAEAGVQVAGSGASVCGVRGYSGTTRTAARTATSESSAISRTTARGRRGDSGGGGSACTGGDLISRSGNARSGRTLSGSSSGSTREGTVLVDGAVDGSRGCWPSRAHRGA